VEAGWPFNPSEPCSWRLENPMRWLTIPTVVVLCAGFAAGALADCVDFSAKRAEAAGAALARKPPTAAQLGMPSLDGLMLDGPRTTGDPKCDGTGPYKRFYYNTSLSLNELVARWHPVIRRRTEIDGMKREWFRNPYHGNTIFMTSGTRIEIVMGRGSEVARLMIQPAPVVGALTPENQPYTAAEIAEGTPWPGGASGPRQFVRADGGNTQTAAPLTASKPVAASDCPPRPAQAGGDGAAQRAGADIGGSVIGGSLGRTIGGALGGVLGSLSSAPAAQPPADPNCP